MITIAIISNMGMFKYVYKVSAIARHFFRGLGATNILLPVDFSFLSKIYFYSSRIDTSNSFETNNSLFQ